MALDFGMKLGGGLFPQSDAIGEGMGIQMEKRIIWADSGVTGVRQLAHISGNTPNTAFTEVGRFTAEAGQFTKNDLIIIDFILHPLEVAAVSNLFKYSVDDGTNTVITGNLAGHDNGSVFRLFLRQHPFDNTKLLLWGWLSNAGANHSVATQFWNTVMIADWITTPWFFKVQCKDNAGPGTDEIYFEMFVSVIKRM